MTRQNATVAQLEAIAAVAADTLVELLWTLHDAELLSEEDISAVLTRIGAAQ